MSAFDATPTVVQATVALLPSPGWTIAITFLFGWFGLIPAVVHSNRSAILGHPTNRYWKAFWLTLIVPIVVTVLMYLALFTAVLGGGALIATSGLPGDVSNGVVADDPGPDDDGAPQGENVEPLVVYVPTDGKLCPQYQESGAFGVAATGNSSTSCPFAAAVRDSVRTNLATWARSGGEVFEVEAYSPVTKKDYTMSCVMGTPVECTGGIAAIVLIFGDGVDVVRN